MKRCLSLFSILLIIVLLAGCTDMLFTTTEYRSYDSFVSNHKPGTDKQTVFNTLGYPDYYKDSQGNSHSIPAGEKANFETVIMDADSVIWVYSCYQYRDPANPYRLTITFDANNQSETAEMTVVPGG